jgi:hypothetical protein
VAYSRDGARADDPFARLHALRERSDRRESLTRLIMGGLFFLAGALLAGLLYLAFVLVSATAQWAVGEAKAHAETRAAAPPR